MPLSDMACKKAHADTKPIKLADSNGLYLYVTPNGAKHWRMKYRFSGKEKLLSFGPYPLLSLAEAREKRDVAKRLILDGIDPSLAKKQEAERSSQNTFEVIAREWHETNKDRWSPNYRQNILHRLEMDIFPELGAEPIGQINAPMLLKTVRAIESRGAHEIAHRAVQTCNQIFRYGIVTGRCEKNPATDLKGALRPSKKGHYAAFESEDIPDFLRKLDRNDARLYQHTVLAIRLMMLTFVRTGELIKAEWTEIDLPNQQWVIPAERMKMKRGHIVPLSSQTVAILQELKQLAGNRTYVFPSQINPRKHMNNNTILKALDRMGYKGEMTGHGFRALAMSTIKEKLGYRHEVVDRQLAHAPANKVDAAYDRAKFLDDRKIMMQDWADYLDEILRKEKFPSLQIAAE